METREVGEHIIDGEHYVLMVKAGFDGQSGRVAGLRRTAVLWIGRLLNLSAGARTTNNMK